MNEFPNIDIKNLETPCFIIDEPSLEKNGKILDNVQRRANCKILLALKGYAAFATFPLIREYLAGVCAGSLFEAKLGREEFGKEVQTYSPAFKAEEFEDILGYSDKIIFNSLGQFKKFMPLIIKSKKKIEVGLRLNPEKSVAGEKFQAYDPCCENSRLGIKIQDLGTENFENIDGLHFHVLCEQGAEELEKVLAAFEQKFDRYIRQVKWVNFGGGHHITKDGYDVERLIRIIRGFRDKYPNIEQVYLEPGEAVALNAGILVTSVVDIVHNKKDIAIIDSSVETHFPDVLITRNEPEPYLQKIVGAEEIRNNEPGKYNVEYTISGVSCAAGDVFGDYSFSKPLKVGDKLIIQDAAHYTMVKTSTFCGVSIPKIMLREKNGNLRTIKTFGYKDYKNRLS